MRLNVGLDVIRSYKRLSYTPWFALAEFVDNALQSYLSNSDILDASYAERDDQLEVRIVYDKEHRLLRIWDNALGMSESELLAALQVGKPPSYLGGLSQYGLGMKTAACWFGDRWTIRTKRLGETEELRVEVDVERVASGEADLPLERVAAPLSEHYTEIEIVDLHAPLKGRTIGKIREFLRSMYRHFTREGRLALYYDDDSLQWDDTLEFLRNSVGTPYRRDFEFDVDGKSVRGFVGILGEGSRGRPRAGFSLLRRGRMVRGHPDAWRPEEIFGQYQGSNNLINQRITGEIHLDEFEVSHTKDGILWQGDEEDAVQTKLRELTLDYLEIAKAWRKGDSPDLGPNEAEVQAAVDELRSELENPALADLIDITEVPPPEAVSHVNRPILEAAHRGEPRFDVVIGESELKAFLATDLSPNDPYVAIEIEDEEVLIVVNMQHPHVAELRGSEGLLNYLRQCVYDGLSEWKCRRADVGIEPDTIRVIKDSLLRLPSRIQQGDQA